MALNFWRKFLIKLKFTNIKQGSYNARIFNNNGQLMAEKNIEHSGADGIQQFNVKNTAGAYTLELTNAGGEKTVIKLIMK